MATLSPLSSLVSELKAAYEKGLIAHYNLNRCTINSAEYVDVHVCLHQTDFHKQEPLRKYLRDKYGLLVRSILIEPF